MYAHSFPALALPFCLVAALVLTSACGADDGAACPGVDASPALHDALDAAVDARPEVHDAVDVGVDANGCEPAIVCDPAGHPEITLGPCETLVASDDGCTCVVVPAPAETPCDDGEPCTTGDLCLDDGTCLGFASAAIGALICNDGNGCTKDVCVEGEGCKHVLTPNESVDRCSGVDDDCDGTTDEDHVPFDTRCGVGACARVGQAICVAGQVVDSCSPGAPAASDASCDGVDDDCDGTADEDYVAVASTCGVGACARVGQKTCTGGVETDSCQPGAPAASDTTCDHVDADCDGQDDEDFPEEPTLCGVGACAATGHMVCVSGQVHDTCEAVVPVAETLNGADDDCNGLVDDTPCAEQVDCEDGDRCTLDACDSGTATCRHAVRSCDDHQLCTRDACDPATGRCTNAPEACDDGVACTNDYCNWDWFEAGDKPPCQHQAIDAACADADPCTLDRCDLTAGCVHDPDPACSPCVLGTPGCTACVAGDACDDGIYCTDDSCDTGLGRCRHDANSFWCNNGTGCNERERCDAKKGCVLDPASECGGTDLCGFGYCHSSGGEGTCVHVSNFEYWGSVCATVSCVPASGATVTPRSCADNDPCTEDLCFDGYFVLDAHGWPVLTDNGADSSGCVHVPISCEDGDPCTLDECSPGMEGCFHTPLLKEGCPGF